MARKMTKVNVAKKENMAAATSKEKLFSRIPQFNSDNSIGIIEPHIVGLEMTTPWYIHDSAEQLEDIHKTVSKILKEANDHISKDAKNYIKGTEYTIINNSIQVKINAIRNEINYLIFNATIQLIDDIIAAIGEIEKTLGENAEKIFLRFVPLLTSLHAMKEAYTSKSFFTERGNTSFSANITYELDIAINNAIHMRNIRGACNETIKNISSSEFETNILQISNSVDIFSYERGIILNAVGMLYYTIGAAVSASFPRTDDLIVSGIPNDVFIMSCIEKKGVFCIYQEKLVSTFNYLHELIDSYTDMGIDIDPTAHERHFEEKYY